MRHAILVGLVIVLGSGPLFAQGVDTGEVDREFSDRIQFLDEDGEVRKIEDVKVVAATFEQVAYEIKGGRTGAPKPGAQIVAIVYGDTPRVYTQGLQALSRGQFAKAESDFDGSKNAVAAGMARAWLLEYASVKKAEAQQLSGNASDAIAEYKKALEANPKSLLFDAIQTGIARGITSAPSTPTRASRSLPSGSSSGRRAIGASSSSRRSRRPRRWSRAGPSWPGPRPRVRRRSGPRPRATSARSRQPFPATTGSWPPSSTASAAACWTRTRGRRS